MPLPELDGVAAIVAVDARADGLPIAWVSPGFELLTGYAASEVVGRNAKLLQGPDTDPRAVSVLTEAIAAGRDAYVTLLNYRADGTPFWNEVAIAPERDGEGRVVRWLGTQRDVTDRMRANARLHELAYYDTLTGLANRAALHDELRSAMHRARVHETEIALLQIDVDDFRRVNERWGHAAGDALLRVAADRLRSVVRPQDVLARVGGDEFSLLLKDLPSGAGERVASELAARILAAARDAPHVVGDLRLETRVSVGIGLYRQGTTTTSSDLVHDADLAVEAAKAAGKDTVRVHRARSGEAVLSPDDAFDPAAAAGVLRELLAAGAITAVYQPVVDLASRAVVGYEALARGPEGSPLHRPDRLLAAAAAAGLTAALDWACRIAAVQGALAAGLGRDVSLFINSTGEGAAAPCPPEHAELWARACAELTVVTEVGERALTARPADLAGALARRRAGGGEVALDALGGDDSAFGLDDLGGDVRALALMGLVGPNVLKVDLGLLRARPAAEQAAVVAAVAAERERGGALVVAERIEEEDDVAAALALGATLGQGWLLGRPGALPAAGSVASAGPEAGRRLRRPSAASGDAGSEPAGTPFTIVSAARPVEEAPKSVLVAMSQQLEEQAAGVAEGAVVLAAFQHARHLTPATLRRYEALARGAALAAVFGVDVPPQPANGVHGVELAADDPLVGEWTVIVLGPHFAGALVACEGGEGGSADAERRFAFATTYDRELVLAAARTLAARLGAPT